MPPTLASLVAVIIIGYGLWLDRSRNPQVTPALWIPVCWLFLTGTRYVSQWLGTSHDYDTPDALLEGSALDQAVFLGLLFAALAVLRARRAPLRSIVALNPWLMAFLAYCLLSVAWSDYPWIAFKRWIKVAEHIAMVMVVITEPNRAQALDSLLRRYTYVTIAVSVLFIKYYPELGRGFEYWTGAAINRGITLDKNALGHICVVAGTFLTSSLFARKRLPQDRNWSRRTIFDSAMLAGAVWLLSIANAKTALVCFLVAVATILTLARTPLGRNPGQVLGLLAFVVITATLAELTLDVRESAIRSLGRDVTLTDRTAVWADVLATPNSTLVGTGFESFWLGERAEALWDKYWWKPNQAHNGLIETYINLGLIGVLLLAAAIVAALMNAIRTLPTQPGVSRLRLALLLAILIFNYTDATFKALHSLYFVFFLLAMAWPTQRVPNVAFAYRRPDLRKRSFRLPPPTR